MGEGAIGSLSPGGTLGVRVGLRAGGFGSQDHDAPEAAPAPSPGGVAWG